MKIQMRIENIDCAHCASKVEEAICKVPGVVKADYQFMSKKMSAEVESTQVIEGIISAVTQIEPHAKCIDLNQASPQKIKWFLDGLDCAHCATKIEQAVQAYPGVNDATLNFMNKTIEFTYTSNERQIENKIKNIILEIEGHLKITEQLIQTDHLRKDLIIVLIGASLFLIGALLNSMEHLSSALFISAYIVLGLQVIRKAIGNLKTGQLFDENFLMTLATIGAFAIGEVMESAAVMLFYRVGEHFQQRAIDRSRKSIQSLMDIRPDVASVKRNDHIEELPVEMIKVNDVIVVKPGEKIALDGIIIYGSTTIDTRALSGESIPQLAQVDSSVLSGSINLSGLIEIQVMKTHDESTVAKILELVENATSKKSKTENFITKFAKVYTPLVIVLALCLMIGLPLISSVSFSESFSRSLAFLVISCPCALVLSIPMSYFGGIGGLSKRGILVKGSSYLEALNDVETIVFDKTGTLTQGKFHLKEIYSSNQAQTLLWAASIEVNSNHPISQAIVAQIDKNELLEISEFEEKAGYGVKALLQGKELVVGSRRWLIEHQIEVQDIDCVGTQVHVAYDGVLSGTLIVSDQIKASSKDAISQLHKLNKRCILLSGDHEEVVKEVQEELNLDEVVGNLLPQDKVSELERIMKNSQGKVAYVGDGINDAPVLAMSDIGFSMGGIGSDAAIEASDIVLMNDDPMAVVNAIKGAKYTRKIVVQNIVFALVVKGLTLIFAGAGVASIWEAIFADVGVALIAVANALRTLRIK